MASFSKLLAAAFVLLGVVRVDAVALSTLSWSSCGSYYCGDLYLCVRNATEWASSTPGATVPYASAFIGWMYGYTTKQDGACIPGAGPIIRMKPGQNYKLTLHNTCDMIAPTADQVANMVTTNDGINYPWANRDKLLHTTNLHLHGVHISGQGDHDNALRTILPGQCLQYVYNIAKEHQPGIFWYHPHFHGKAAYQTIGGAFGSIIIEDPDASSGLVSGTTSSNRPIDSNVQKFLSNKAIERIVVAYQETPLFMGNGDPNGAAISLTKNQWHRLRLQHVRPEATITQSTFQFATKLCEIYELAADGVYFSTVPFQPYNSPPVQQSTVPGTLYPFTYDFSVTGASRLDLAIRCTAVGTFKLQYSGGIVATFTVTTSNNVGSETPFTGSTLQQWFPTRPAYLTDLRDSSRLKGTTVATEFPVQPGFSGINGKLFNLNSATATFPFGPSTIQQLVYMNTGSHPIHMHQHHVQIVQPGGCGKAFREGQFYDTVSHVDNAECRVRVRFLDFSGPTLIHCHILDHEDMGMMGWFNIPKGGWEATSSFSNKNLPYNCCVPRKDPISGKAICRVSTQCGSTSGYDTCNNVCAVSQKCPSSTPKCSTTGVCYKSADDVAPVPETSNATCDAPVYPFVIMGVGLAVAAVSVVIAVCAVRRASDTYGAVLLEELKPEANPVPSPASPFHGAPSPSAIMSHATPSRVADGV